MKKRILSVMCAVILTFAVTACSGSDSDSNLQSSSGENNSSAASENTSGDVSQQDEVSSVTNVTVQFGNEGKTYLITMENNATAAELVRNIGESGRNLPIYDYDNFEGWEYFQYYDIPSRYDIPSDPETITSAKAGEVYYSDPNRVVLFYNDAEISGEYTKVGVIQDIEGLAESVENNPVLDGWGNKLILLRYAN